MSSELMEIMELAEKNGIERGMQRGIEQGMQRGIEQGMQRGIEQGMQRGIEQGMQQGIQQGKSDSIINALKMNYITIENAATILNISKEKLEQMIKQ